MASKLEELLSRSISALENRNKPLPPRPSPERPQRLTDYFLPSSPTQPPGSRSWSPPLISPKAPPSLSGFTLSPTPPAPLPQRQSLDKPPLVSKEITERLSLLENENNKLRQENKVLYKQSSDYKDLVQEYQTSHENTNDSIERIKAARETIEQIIRDVTTEIKAYENTKAKIWKIEKIANRDWQRFISDNTILGIEVEEIIKDIIEKHAVEIKVYHKEFNNMI
jgi:hypothetical protein